MNDKEKMNNLEPIPGEPGWFVNPETGEVFNENDPSNYEEGEDGNYGDEEDWDDENDPYGEDLENDNESNEQESDEGEPNNKKGGESEGGEGGEDGSARDALKNSQEGAKDTAKGAEKAAESATNAGAKAAASAAEGVAGAGGAAAGSGAAASGAAAAGSAAAGGAATAGGTAAAPWIAGAVAVVVIVVLLLLFFMALMGYGSEIEDTGRMETPSTTTPVDMGLVEYCTAGYKEGFYTTDEAKRIFGSTESKVESELEWVNFPVATTGRILVHRKAAPCFEAVGKEIVALNTGYTMVNYGTFNWRPMRGGTRLSMHSFGIAIDINKPENCFRCGRPPNCKTDIPPEIVEAFQRFGFNWGGNWRSVCDAMHFEWHGAKR